MRILKRFFTRRKGKVLIKFPEHDIEVDAKANYNMAVSPAGQHLSHGCMTGQLANVCVQAVHASIVRSSSKKPYTSFSANQQTDMVSKTGSAFGNYKFSEEELTQLFTPIIPMFTQTFVLIADRVNTGSNMYPTALGGYFTSYIKTTDFVEWLIRNKKGIVTSSPIGRNPNHANPKAFSIVQAFIWTPPMSVPNIIKFTEQTFYPDDGPNHHQWADTANKAIAFNYGEPPRDWENFKRNAFKDSPLFSRVKELK